MMAFSGTARWACLGVQTTGCGSAPRAWLLLRQQHMPPPAAPQLGLEGHSSCRHQSLCAPPPFTRTHAQVVDGAALAGASNALKAVVEEPARMLLHVA